MYNIEDTDFVHLTNMLQAEIVLTDAAWSAGPGEVEVATIDINQDGTKISFTNEPASCSIYAARSGSLLGKMDQKFTQSHIVGMRFIPGTEDILIGAAKDGALIAYDSIEGQVLATHKHLGGNISCLAMDPFGDSFTFGCADGSLRVHDVETLTRTGVLLRTMSKSVTGQTSGVFDVAYHPEDSNIVISAATDRVYIWDVRTGASERAFVGTHVRGSGIAIYQNTVYTASLRDSRQLEEWDLATAKKVKELTGTQKTGPLSTVAVGRNGLVCVAGGVDGTLIAFDLFHGTEMNTIQTGASAITDVAVSQQSDMVTVGTERGQVFCHMMRKKPFHDD